MGQDNPTTDIDEGSLLLSIIVTRSWRKKIAIKSQKSLMLLGDRSPPFF
jgi:hypothetical protein